MVTHGGSRGKSICLIGASGGAGVTTVACNLAVALARMGPVGLIDADLSFGNAAQYFDRTPHYTMASVCTCDQIDQVSLRAAMIETEHGVSILARPNEITERGKVTPGKAAGLMHAACRAFHFVVVDLFRQLDELVGTFMLRSDLVFIVTEMNVSSINNARRIRSALVEEGFDVAVRLGQPPDSRLVARQLIGGAFVTCAAPAYLKRHGTPRAPEDLARHNCARFVVPSTGVAREWVFQRDGKRFIVPVGGNFTFDHAECLVEAAKGGTAVVQIASYVLGDAFRNRSLEPVLTRFQVESPAMWVLYPQNRHLTPRVRAFVDFLVEAAKEGRLSSAVSEGRRLRRLSKS